MGRGVCSGCLPMHPGFHREERPPGHGQLTLHELLQLPHCLGGGSGTSLQNLEGQEELFLLTPRSIAAAATEGETHLCSKSEMTQCGLPQDRPFLPRQGNAF